MNAKSDKWTAAIRRNTRQLFYWTLAWVLTLAVAAFGPKFLWDFNPLISILVIVINTGIGIGMILANKRHLNGLDEMQRKLNLEAMAIALGAAVVGGVSYSMLDAGNVIAYDAEIGHLVALIGITYLVGVIVGNLRYK